MISPKDFIVPIFTTRDATYRLKKSAHAVAGILKRETSAGRTIRVRKGLYAFPENKEGLLDALILSPIIYGPSYISLEYALSYHGLIPESVVTITSVSQGKSKHFSTPLGEFSYQRVPQQILYSQVERVEGQGGGCFFMATPLKALCDTLYCHKKKWLHLTDACRDLRIDPEDLPQMTGAEVDELIGNYKNSTIRNFLMAIKKEVA